MWQVTWSVKASKLCNLRCRYCYEWDGLGDPRRIPLSGWRRIFEAVREYHALQRERHRRAGRSVVVLHGGEPLVLPMSYLTEVIGLGREILGPRGFERGEYAWGVQTNLDSLPGPKLDLLEEEAFWVSVSFDGAPGVRVRRSGAETETRVAANLSRLLRRDLRASGVVVLAGHTRKRLCGAYDFFARRAMPFRVLPLLPGPHTGSNPSLAISHEETLAALAELFVHWLDDGCRVEVEPLRSCLTTALLTRLSLERTTSSRREGGERTLVVDTDGSLYPRPASYGPAHRLGNLFRTPIHEILASPGYRASLAADDRRLRRHCRGCRFRRACDSLPILASPALSPPGPCPVESALSRRILELLEQEERTPPSAAPKRAAPASA